MIACDLCGEPKKCLQKEIDGKEYDICSECWNRLAEQLKGKGRHGPRHRRQLEAEHPSPKN